VIDPPPFVFWVPPQIENRKQEKMVTSWPLCVIIDRRGIDRASNNRREIGSTRSGTVFVNLSQQREKMVPIFFSVHLLFKAMQCHYRSYNPGSLSIVIAL
jgi:hypothetical protein